MMRLSATDRTGALERETESFIRNYPASHGEHAARSTLSKEEVDFLATGNCKIQDCWYMNFMVSMYITLQIIGRLEPPGACDPRSRDASSRYTSSSLMRMATSRAVRHRRTAETHARTHTHIHTYTHIALHTHKPL